MVFSFSLKVGAFEIVGRLLFLGSAAFDWGGISAMTLIHKAPLKTEGGLIFSVLSAAR